MEIDIFLIEILAVLDTYNVLQPMRKPPAPDGALKLIEEFDSYTLYRGGFFLNIGDFYAISAGAFGII